MKRDVDRRPLIYSVHGHRPLDLADLNESLIAEVVRAGEHVLLDAVHMRRIDVCGLVRELIDERVPVAVGTIDVGVAADVLLGILPGESLGAFRARLERDGPSFKRSLWDWRHAAAMAGMRAGLNKPLVCVLDRDGATLIDGHHRLGAHAFRMHAEAPMVLIDSPGVVARHSTRIRRPKFWRAAAA